MEYKILEYMFKDEKPVSVLEIGCGTGGLLEDIAKEYPGIKVAGMDTSRIALDEAQKRLPQGEFILHDINDPWPFAYQSFDIVFCVGVLMYMWEPLPIIKEMLRVGKKVVIAEYHHPEVDIYGTLTRGYWDKGKVHMGLLRNYLELFAMNGIKLTATVSETGLGKTVIKFTKNETPATS